MVQPEHLHFFFVYPISLDKYYSLMLHDANEFTESQKSRAKLANAAFVI